MPQQRQNRVWDEKLSPGAALAEAVCPLNHRSAAMPGEFLTAANALARRSVPIEEIREPAGVLR